MIVTRVAKRPAGRKLFIGRVVFSFTVASLLLLAMYVIIDRSLLLIDWELDKWRRVSIGASYDDIVEIYGREADDTRMRGEWKLVSFFRPGKRLREAVAELKSKNEPYRFMGLSTFLLDSEDNVVAKFHDGDIGSFESILGIEFFDLERVTDSKIEEIKRQLEENALRVDDEC